MLLLEVNWPHVWLVTLLGFSIVLLLLIVLVFVMMAFGWIMQLLNKPKAEKPAAAPVAKPAPAAAPAKAGKAEDQDLAAVAMALSMAGGADKAAIAMALYLSRGHKDFPTPLMPAQSRPTAWNAKAYNMNNIGF